MDIEHTIIQVDGMSCSSCETRIERAILSIQGIRTVKADFRSGTVSVDYDPLEAHLADITGAIEKTGYTVKKGKASGTAAAVAVGIFLVAAYLFADSRGLFAAVPGITTSIGFAALFVVGLLTSIHCVAMCGGIALAQSVNNADKADAKSTGFIVRMAPALAYNAGRVLSYTVIGAIVGAAGSVFAFSPAIKAVITAIAGALMLVFALRLLGLLKHLPDFSRVIPAPWRTTFGGIASRMSNGGPFTVGLLNGLMPCGPMQAMQLYALGTGSALTGALSMLIFSVGTVPLMLAFGTTATLLPRKFIPAMMKASAMLVLFLGLATFARAASLSGIALPSGPAIASESEPERTTANEVEVGYPGNGILKAKVENGVQTIVTEFKGGQYVPFAVQSGIPVKWTIRVRESDLTGCNNPVTVPAYGIEKELVPGDNLVEFTPGKEGTIGYSCWMGMVRSTITIVNDIANSGSVAPGAGSSAKAGAAQRNCCSGMSGKVF